MNAPPIQPATTPAWEPMLKVFGEDLGRQAFITNLLCSFEAGMRLAACHPELVEGLRAHCVPVQGLEYLALSASGLGAKGDAAQDQTARFEPWEDAPPRFLVPFLPTEQEARHEFWRRLGVAMGTAAARRGFVLPPGLVDKNPRCNMWARSAYWHLLRRYLARRLELLVGAEGEGGDPRPRTVRLIEFACPRHDLEREVLARHALAIWNKILGAGRGRDDPLAWAREGFRCGFVFARDQREECQRLVASVHPAVIPLQRDFERQFMPRGAKTLAEGQKAIAGAVQKYYQCHILDSSPKLADFIRDHYDFGFWMGIVRARGTPRRRPKRGRHP